MNRPILIDLTVGDKPIHRFRAFHVPRIGETISSFAGEFEGDYEVVKVNHLLGRMASCHDHEKNYLQLVTIEVKQLTQEYRVTDISDEIPNIMINGHQTNGAEATTIKRALTHFLDWVTENGLGDDEHGKFLSKHYLEHGCAMLKIMNGQKRPNK